MSVPSERHPGNTGFPQQRAVLKAYEVLHAFALRHLVQRPGTAPSAGGIALAGAGVYDAMGGRLVVSLSLQPQLAEFGLATTIGGGAFLGIEPRAVRIKDAMRSGCCDFMVNTLDEALRVLKNEVRKRKPVSVGLLGAPEQMLRQMVERGVLPDLLLRDMTAERALEPSVVEPVRELEAMGAVVVDTGSASADTARADTAVSYWTSWKAEAGMWNDLKTIDALAQPDEVAADGMRRRWLQYAPGAFRRQMTVERNAMLTVAEFEALTERVRTEAELGRLRGRVVLEQGDRTVSILPAMMGQASGT